MKLLITGINGFIGQNLQSYFVQSDHELIGIEKSDNFSKLNIKQYVWEELDKIDKADCIIHLAGLAHDTKNLKLEDEYFQVNTELTKTIFNFFLTSSANTFIFFSTIKAASDFSETPLDETHVPEPTSIYGKSKLKAEEYILNNLPNDGRNVYILRPCMIHGPNAKGNLVSLYKYIKRGLPYPFGNLSNTRSYLSISNLNFILGKLLETTQQSSKRETQNAEHYNATTQNAERKTQNTTTQQRNNATTQNAERHNAITQNVFPASGIYHLADDQPLSTTRIVELIGETIHKKPFMMNLPKWIFLTLGQLGTALHLPVNNETIKKLTGNFLVSNEKIKKALNIDSFPVSAEEGMRLTLRNIDNI